VIRELDSGETGLAFAAMQKRPGVRAERRRRGGAALMLALSLVLGV
jgi:hypothetical protein